MNTDGNGLIITIEEGPLPDFVQVNGVDYFPASPLPPEEGPFKIGDFVRVVDSELRVGGMVGKVVTPVDLPTKLYGIEFPALVNGHDCSGAAVPNHGWYVEWKQLEQIV